MRGAAVATVLTFGAAMPAAASVIHITHTGHVAGGSDDQGQFGAAGADLTGQAFMLMFSIDTATAAHYDNSGAANYPYDDYEGATSAVFTLNGVTKTLAGVAGGNSFAYRQYLSGDNAPYFSMDQTYINGQNYVFDELQSSNAYFSSLIMTTPFTYTTTAADRGQSNSTGYFRYNGQQLSFTDDTISSDGGQAVPEPGALGLLGMGLLGVTLRRKRAA